MGLKILQTSVPSSFRSKSLSQAPLLHFLKSGSFAISSGSILPPIEGDEETLTIWNHPFRYDDTIRDINRCGKDVVEITEHGDFFYNVETPSSKIVERSKLPSVATDDAHSKRMVGHSWIWVRASEKAKDEIIRNIKKGDFSVEKREI